jgi:hypothetical protein
MHIDGHASAVVFDSHGTVGQQSDLNPVAMPGEGFVHRVIHDLPDEVVQASLRGGADVHARAFTDRLKAFKYLNGTT